MSEIDKRIRRAVRERDRSHPYGADPNAKALRAVVDLHAPKPTIINGTRCTECDDLDYPVDYPCDTVRAIARELGVSDE